MDLYMPFMEVHMEPIFGIIVVIALTIHFTVVRPLLRRYLP